MVYYTSIQGNLQHENLFHLLCFSIIFRLIPLEDFDSKPEVTISYMGTYGSAITYCIGFMFGTLYWKNKTKNKKIFDTMVSLFHFSHLFSIEGDYQQSKEGVCSGIFT